jgi:hypothetical protein
LLSGSQGLHRGGGEQARLNGSGLKWSSNREDKILPLAKRARGGWQEKKVLSILLIMDDIKSNPE